MPDIVNVPPSPATGGVSLECMERFARNFEISARRWELIVYPSLFAFIVLASYGFFLIYHLTSDVASLARNVSAMTQSIDGMTRTVSRMTDSVKTITDNMASMDQTMLSINQKMTVMTNGTVEIAKKMDALDPMQSNIHAIDMTIRAMALSVNNMSHSMYIMNRSIGQASAPMQAMSNFMPW